MKKLSQTVIVAFGLCFGCSRNNVDSPAQFTREFTEALRQSSPGIKVEIVNNTEIDVTKTNGSHFTAFLDNAYDLYSHDPKSKDKIIQEFVAADLESLVVLDVSHKVDPTRIVPVVKDKLWLEEFERDRAEHGKKKIARKCLRRTEFRPDHHLC